MRFKKVMLLLLSLVSLCLMTLTAYAATPQVAAGDSYTVGLKSDGTLVAVGMNEDGQCDVGSWTDILQMAVGGSHTVGLKSDGTVVAVGNNDNGQCDVGDWTGIYMVAAGGSHTLGIKMDGTVVAVGPNDDGQCDVGSWTNIVQAAAGGGHTVGLKSDGTVVAAGYNGDGQCDVGSWTNIVQVAAGVGHTVGLKSDGTAVAVGWNDSCQCNVGTWTNIVQVAAGFDHTVGLESDGTVVSIGDNLWGQCDVDLSSWTEISRLASGPVASHTLGLKSDGTVVAAGAPISGACDVNYWALNLGAAFMTDLLFPYFASSSAYWRGIAVPNPSTSDGTINLTLHDEAGHTSTATVNLNAGGLFVNLLDNINWTGSADVSGRCYITATLNFLGGKGFAMFGDGGANSMGYVVGKHEGASPITLLFPYFASSTAYWRGIAIVNPSASDGTINLTLNDESGNTSTATVTLGAGNMFVDLLQNINWIGSADVSGRCSVIASMDFDGGGFAMFGDNGANSMGYVVDKNLAFVANLLFPYFASSATYWRGIAITNPAQFDDIINLTLRDAAGDTSTATINLNAGNMFVDLLQNINWTGSADVSGRCYVLASSNFTGGGFAMFGDNGANSMGYVVDKNLVFVTNLLFPYFASSAAYWRGIVISNLSLNNGVINLTLHDEAGNTSMATVYASAGGMSVNLLENITWTGTANVSGRCYITATMNFSGVGFAMFGDGGANSMGYEIQGF